MTQSTEISLWLQPQILEGTPEGATLDSRQLDIEDGEVLAGGLPRKQLRLVQAWIELHRDELQADWELAVSGENPYKITPL
ncbi:MAG: DUF4160 domain-containing protein [Anaerolineales bacterium]|nr:DUF4160 domain-containing protein [Anaerolineales bacterium]